MLMTKRIEISVRCDGSDKSIFRRSVDMQSSVHFDYDLVERSLLLLFSGLNIVVDFNISYYGK